MKTSVTQYIRTCGCCGNPRAQIGGGVRATGGLRQWVCGGCKLQIYLQKMKVTL
jgi:hypothetical protein